MSNANRFVDNLLRFQRDLPRQRTLRDARPLPDGRIEIAGCVYDDFSSNDYLGLAHHPAVIDRSLSYLREFGAGSTASRLISGNHPACRRIETRVAEIKGTDDALVMAGGFTANATVLAALLQPAVHDKVRPVVFCDRLIHASMHFGIQAAGLRQTRFRHNDLQHLEEKLVALRRDDAKAPAMIVTESVFSMDGDRADIAALRELAFRFDALLYIDEAHATGVLGDAGSGLAGRGSKSNPANENDVIVTTFGKALGSFGACLASASGIRDFLINRCSGLIYATALPPATLGAIEAALELLPSLDKERAHMADLAHQFRNDLRGRDVDCGNSTTQIVPVILGDEGQTMRVANDLFRQGIVVGAIRPPTVPVGQSRLRVSFSAAHTADQLQRLITSLEKALPS